MDGLNNDLPTRLRNGDPGAWSEFYDHYAPRVWEYTARRLGGSSADVADVVQETFLAAARSVRGFDPAKGTLWAWLTGISARNVARNYRKRTDHLRRARRWWSEQCRLNGGGGAWLAGAGEAPDSILAAGELAELVRAALAELPEDYQALLVGKYLDKTAGEELAARIGISNQALRARLYRARKAFQKAFLMLAGDDAIHLRSADHD